MSKGGDPKTDQEGTNRTPGWHPEEKATLVTATQLTKVLSNQRGLLQRTPTGRDPKTLERAVKLREGVVAYSLRKPTSYFLGGPRIQFIYKVLDFPVVLRRHGTYCVTVRKTVEIPQLQLMDKLVISVFVQRQVPGRDSADNCGGSAVSWGPCGDSAGAVLGQV